MGTDKDWTRFKNIGLGLTGPGIIIGIAFATIGYLGPIKTNTNFLSSINDRLVIVQEKVELIPLIKDDLSYLRGKTVAQITPSNGGQLTSTDWHTTVTVPPKSISQPVLLAYEPVATRNLPASLSQGIEFLNYNFSLIPHTPTGTQLANLTLEKPADLYIAHTSLDLDPQIVKPENLVLFNWNQKEGEWAVTEATIIGNNLHAKISQFSLFSLGVDLS